MDRSSRVTFHNQNQYSYHVKINNPIWMSGKEIIGLFQHWTLSLCHLLFWYEEKLCCDTRSDMLYCRVDENWGLVGGRGWGGGGQSKGQKEVGQKSEISTPGLIMFKLSSIDHMTWIIVIQLVWWTFNIVNMLNTFLLIGGLRGWMDVMDGWMDGWIVITPDSKSRVLRHWSVTIHSEMLTQIKTARKKCWLSPSDKLLL